MLEQGAWEAGLCRYRPGRHVRGFRSPRGDVQDLALCCFPVVSAHCPGFHAAMDSLSSRHLPNNGPILGCSCPRHPAAVSDKLLRRKCHLLRSEKEAKRFKGPRPRPGLQTTRSSSPGNSGWLPGAVANSTSLWTRGSVPGVVHHRSHFTDQKTEARTRQ